MKPALFNSPAKILSLVFVLLVVQYRAAALTILNSAVNPANGHVYVLLNNSDWTTAEGQAIVLGGHLVTINDAAENTWVSGQFGANRNLWLGLNDAAVEGTFVWASSEPVTYTNWRSGEPNNGNTGEDYAYMYGLAPFVGQWNDYENNATVPPEPLLFGVVEIVPEPSVCALLAGAGLVGLLKKFGKRGE